MLCRNSFGLSPRVQPQDDKHDAAPQHVAAGGQHHNPGGPARRCVALRGNIGRRSPDRAARLYPRGLAGFQQHTLRCCNMADFPLYDGAIFEAIGVSAGDSKATTLTSGAANTKGSWVELTSSAPEGVTSFFVMLYNTQESSGSSRIYVDIGIGAAASEVVLVPNLRSLTRVQNCAICFPVPLPLPGGVRVAARMQSGTAGTITADVALGVFRGHFLSSSPLTEATHYGLTTASTSGTQVDPGASANTKGAAAELTSSTTNQIRSILIMLGNGTQSNPPTRSDDGYLIDIGVGATPDYIISNLPVSTMSIDDCVHPRVIGPFDCCIPVGTRIVARAQSSENADPPRTFDISILGFN